MKVLTSDAFAIEDRHHWLIDGVASVATVHLVDDLDDVRVSILGRDDIRVVQQVRSPLLFEEAPDLLYRIQAASASWQEVVDHAELLHALLHQARGVGRVIVHHEYMAFDAEIGESVTKKFVDGETTTARA